MPTNLYGPGDNYHPENSHVIPGLIYRFHQAKIKNLDNVSVWGTGKPKREFLYVDDMADAAIYIMNLNKKTYEETINQASHINIGSGEEITIKNLAEIIKKVTGYKGKINYDISKVDGSLKKIMNSNLLNSLGWKKKTNLEDGLTTTYMNFTKLL